MSWFSRPKPILLTVRFEPQHDITVMELASIECKPSVGDDFPEVLRQCKRQKNAVTMWAGKDGRWREFWLVIGEYAGDSLPFEQVKIMFESSGIGVLRIAK